MPASHPLPIQHRIRPIRALALVVATAVLLAACGGSDTDEAGDAGADTEQTTTSTAGDREAQVDLIVDSTVTDADEAGFELDADCVRDVVEQLGDDDLAVLAESFATDDDAEPELSEEGDALGEELGDCAFVEESAGPSTIPPAETGIDACSLIPADVLATVFTGLDAGTASDHFGAFGTGVGCAWETANGERVRLGVSVGADLEAWRAEATNGDGLNDGDPIDAGDEGYFINGTVRFALGEDLVEITCFPGFDLPEGTLLTLADAVEAAL